MKEVLMYFVIPSIITIIIMTTSIDVYKRKVETSETSCEFFNKHGKIVLYFFTFIANMIMVFILLAAHGVYMANELSKPIEINEQIPIQDSLKCDTIQQQENVCKKNDFITHVTLTTYNPVVEQCDADPLITADGTKIDLYKLKRKEIKYCAVSRNLLAYLPLGSTIEIEGHGVYEVRDTMNKRYKHCIDILQDISEKNFKKHNIKVKLIKKYNA